MRVKHLPKRLRTSETDLRISCLLFIVSVLSLRPDEPRFKVLEGYYRTTKDGPGVVLKKRPDQPTQILLPLLYKI